MNSDINKTSVDKLFKKGKDELKTSLLSLKFKPDYLSAVSYFTEAAKGYKKLRMFPQSLLAFEEAIKCNKKVLESWPEAQNWSEMADIYIFELSDFTNGWKYLKNASTAYKISGKFTSGIKVYLDYTNKLIEKNNNYKDAVVILKQAVEDCFDQTHDELIRISLEDSFTKLLDVLCYLENYIEAIELIDKYIKMQKTIKSEPKHKISTNYLKSGMLRIIIGELYMAEHLIDEMFTVYDSSCSDDIDDLKKLIKSFKDINKKDFNYLMTYAFSLFQNNLLKALKKTFDKLTEQQSNVSGNPGIFHEQGQIILSNNSVLNDLDETKANSEIGTINEVITGQNQIPNSRTDDYL